jgi:uncharacterized membrane protein YsdA (DUF1294 family)
MIPRPPRKASRSRNVGGVGASAWAGLALLLAVPVYALSRLLGWVDWRVLAGVPLVVSVFTFLAYRSDKRRAEAGQWRIPEQTLHIAELLGGWPGAFLAQRIFRHKTAKTSFQVVFWAIVLAHQFTAIESVTGWRMSKAVVRLIQGRVV